MNRDVPPPSQTGHKGPLLIVLSGPSGVGKDAVLNKMREQNHPRRHYTVTATTRQPRAGEKEGVDYYFLSESTFQQMVKQGDFLEWAEVYGHWYGVPKQQVKEALAEDKDVIIKVDVQGAATIKRILPQAIFVFLITSLEELTRRLEQRDTESDSNMQLRIKEAGEELKYLPLFDYLVVNQRGKIDLAVSQINAIIEAERHRGKSREIKL